MAINKVVYGNDTLIDLTNDTATEDDVLEGVTFHDKSGSLRSGSLKPVLDVEVDGNSIVDQDGVANITSDNLSVIAKDLTENKTATVTDGVADFETIDGSLVKSLVVEIEPSQSGSGTPSPDNIRPITGWTQEDVRVEGKNRLPFFTEVKQGATCIVQPLSNGRYDFYGTATGSTAIQYGLNNLNLNGVYRFVADYVVQSGSNITLYYHEKSGGDAKVLYPNETIDLTVNEITTIAFFVSRGTTINYRNIGLMLVPSTETDLSFEPYHGKTYTTPFNQTVYGGTLDVLTGELTIDRASVDMGSLNWFITQSNTFKAGVTDIKIATSAGEDSELVCSIYDNTTTDHNTGASKPDDTIWRYAGSTAHVVVKDSAYSDATTFKTAVTGQTLVYPLATPTTISLTPQKVKSLVGENHIMASTGDVLECKYSMLINGDDLDMLLSSIS